MIHPVGEEDPVADVGEAVVKCSVPQLVLEFLAVRHVAQGEDDAEDLCRLREAGSDDVHVDPAAVGVEDPPRDPDRARARSRQHGIDERDGVLEVIGMNEGSKSEIVGCFEAIPQDRFHRGGLEADNAVRLCDRDDIGCVLDQSAEPRFALALVEGLRQVDPVDRQGQLGGQGVGDGLRGHRQSPAVSEQHPTRRPVAP